MTYVTRYTGNQQVCISPKISGCSLKAVIGSDVDRGQTPEDEAEDEDKTPRTRPRTKSRGRGQGRGHFFFKFEKIFT